MDRIAVLDTILYVATFICIEFCLLNQSWTVGAYGIITHLSVLDPDTSYRSSILSRRITISAPKSSQRIPSARRFFDLLMYSTVLYCTVKYKRHLIRHSFTARSGGFRRRTWPVMKHHGAWYFCIFRFRSWFVQHNIDQRLPQFSAHPCPGWNATLPRDCLWPNDS